MINYLTWGVNLKQHAYCNKEHCQIVGSDIKSMDCPGPFLFEIQGSDQNIRREKEDSAKSKANPLCTRMGPQNLDAFACHGTHKDGINHTCVSKFPKEKRRDLLKHKDAYNSKRRKNKVIGRKPGQRIQIGNKTNMSK